METRRQRIADLIQNEARTPSELADELDATPAVVISDLRHVARSLDAADRQLLVAPPACRECGFENFDDRLNRPSRCPSCRSESIAEPEVTIG